MIVISNTKLEEIFEIAVKRKFLKIFEIVTKVTKTERVVLRVIEVIIINKAIAKIVTNFLKTRLIYLF